jgi:isopenicillin N synthase-like dioxygenase
MDTSQSIGITILSALSSALGVPETERFEKFHGSNTLTNSMLAFNRHPEHNADDRDIGHNTHTDVGSIAILFASQWGLQALDSRTEQWQFIRPLEGHVVVNVGDALRHMSRNRLQSSLHRVVPIPGIIEQEERFSLVYFMEPDRGTIFRDQGGNEYTAEQWHDLKMASFKKSHEAIEASLQTGQAVLPGLWSKARTGEMTVDKENLPIEKCRKQ